MGTDDRRRILSMAVGGLVWALGLASASVPSGVVLTDGMWLGDVEGRLVRDGDRWLFCPAEPVRQASTVAGSGTTLELLPSPVWEAAAADAAQRPEGRALLSGQVEVYRGRSYLFATSAVPLGPAQSAGQADPNDPARLPVGQGADPNGPAYTLPDADDPLAIPEQIQKRLAAYEATRQRAPRTTQVPAGLRVLVDEVGLIVPGQGRVFFVTDALGQNAMPRAYELHPCRTLESMERVQSQSPEPARFRVSGLVTEHRGQSYLLPHRAVREYHYGNLGG